MDYYSPINSPLSPSYSPTNDFKPYHRHDNPYSLVLRYPEKKETKPLDARFDQSPDLKS